jgi:hypothetical protein
MEGISVGTCAASVETFITRWSPAAAFFTYRLWISRLTCPQIPYTDSESPARHHPIARPSERLLTLSICAPSSIGRMRRGDIVVLDNLAARKEIGVRAPPRDDSPQTPEPPGRPRCCLVNSIRELSGRVSAWSAQRCLGGVDGVTTSSPLQAHRTVAHRLAPIIATALAR